MVGGKKSPVFMRRKGKTVQTNDWTKKAVRKRELGKKKTKRGRLIGVNIYSPQKKFVGKKNVKFKSWEGKAQKCRHGKRGKGGTGKKTSHERMKRVWPAEKLHAQYEGLKTEGRREGRKKNGLAEKVDFGKRRAKIPKKQLTDGTRKQSERGRTKKRRGEKSKF